MRGLFQDKLRDKFQVRYQDRFRDNFPGNFPDRSLDRPPLEDCQEGFRQAFLQDSGLMRTASWCRFQGDNRNRARLGA